MKKRILISDTIILLSMIFIITYISLPFLKVIFSGIISKIIFVFLNIVLLLFASISSKRWFSFFAKKILPFIAIYGLIVLLNILFYRYQNQNDILSSLDVFLMLCFIGIGSYFYINDEKRISSVIISVFVICLIITVITTLKGLNINSNYSRILSSSTSSRQVVMSLRRMNIGAYDFIYSLIILVFAFIKVIPGINNKYLKAFLLVLITFSSLCVIKANFTMATIFLIMVIMISFIPTKMATQKFVINNLLIIAFFIIVAKPLFIGILNFFDNYYSSIYMKSKIEGLLLFLNGDGTLSDTTLRVGLMKQSIVSFVNNVFAGVGLFYHDFSIVGGHSQLLDDLARFGLFSFAIFLPIFNYFKLLISFDNTNKNNIIILFLLYLIFSILNVTSPYYISLTFFIVIPIIFKYFLTQKEVIKR